MTEEDKHALDSITEPSQAIQTPPPERLRVSPRGLHLVNDQVVSCFRYRQVAG
jgi:hypothetical protein